MDQPVTADEHKEKVQDGDRKEGGKKGRQRQADKDKMSTVCLFGVWYV